MNLPPIHRLTNRNKLTRAGIIGAVLVTTFLATGLIYSANINPDTVYIPLLGKSGQTDWLQFNFDAVHSGFNPTENRITTGNVGNLTKLFQVQLPDIADGSPVYLSNVNTPGGLRNVVYVTTRLGTILALDADTGAVIWSKQYGPNGCLVNNSHSRNEACYTTSSPVIDPNRAFVFSYGLDGYVHKYSVGDGSETISGGWPEQVTLKGYDEKGSSALSMITVADKTSYLYAAQSGYPGDQGNYQGHLTVINLSTGTQKVFNTLCSNQAVHFVDSRTTNGPDCYPNTMGAVWARPGVVYDPYHDRILFATGNATFDPSAYLWGDSVLSINPDGSSSNGNPLDSYTPVDFQHLEDGDLDLGSTAPAILPPATGKFPHLAVQGGKDSILRLINLDNLSGQGSAGFTGGEVFSTTVSMGGAILTQPAVWNNPADHTTWIFASNSSGMAAYQLSVNMAGDPSLALKWTSGGGTSPIVANGIVFNARSGSIAAFSATDGSLLWSDSRIGSIHWESPIICNGVLYITDGSKNLTAYSLP